MKAPAPPAPTPEGSSPVRTAALDDFASFYRAYAPMVERMVIASLRRGPHVEDLVQGVFVRIWLARDRFEPRGHAPSIALECWVSAITRNLVRSHRRRVWAHRRRAHAHRELAPAQSETPEQAALGREWRALASASLRSARGEPHLGVLEAHVVDDVPYRVLAEQLRVTEGALRVRAHRACRRLRADLEPIWRARP